MASTKNLTMGDLMARFRCEDACREYLEALRWPDGVRCPRCESDTVSVVKGRNQYQCRANGCRYHFSVMAGTKLQDSKLPLWKWFLTVFLMIHAKKGISAKQLQRMVGGSYETAWFLCHRIRAAMKDFDDEKLTGEIEIDETFVGGRERHPDPEFLRFGNKEIVIAAVERGGRKRVRFDVIPNRGKRTLHKWVKETTADDTKVYYTDDHRSYQGIGDENTEHHTIVHSKKEWVHEKVHTNTVEGVFSLLKRALIGSYHKVGSKHLQSYLDEVAFKYNNRGNPYLFRETLRALIGTEALPYDQLVKAS